MLFCCGLLCALAACRAETAPALSHTSDAGSVLDSDAIDSDAIDSDALDSDAVTAAAGSMDGGAAGATADASFVPGAGYPGRPGFCERAGADAIRDLFCGSAPPSIDSLRALQLLIGVNPSARASSPSAYDAGAMEYPSEPSALDASAGTADGGLASGDASTPRAYDAGESYPAAASSITTVIVDYVVLLGHSTALSGHLVSPLNPRVIMAGSGTVMAFSRGVQQVELITSARDRGGFNFYLLNFEQACTKRAGGCAPGDLFTPRIEADWTRVVARDAEELKNTPSDCRQCHQRGKDAPVLLMRELQSPWTHFFEPDPEGSAHYALPGVRGQDLVEDYVHAKGDEPYGGVPARTARQTVGFFLQNLAGEGQPLFFDAPTIEAERWPPDAAGHYAAEPKPSPTWERGYEAFKRGEQLALPYLEPRVTDPQKQARLSEAYRAYRAGQLPAEQLPDLSDIFPDDALVRARIGLQTEPGATPVEALIQACGSCHNDVLDQTISRANFNIALSRMSRAELDLALDRLQRGAGAAGVMPPPEGRQLDPAALAALVSYLQKNQRSADDDARLERAAQLGMAGGARR